MNELVKIVLLFTISVILSSCIFDDEEEKWDAAKVCPETGTNAYGMPNRGTFTDERDGHVYRYTTIGNQVWMAENLRYKLPYPYSYAPGEDYFYVDEQKKDTVYRHDTTGLGEIGITMQSKCADADCIAAEFVKTFGRYYSLTVNAGRHGPLDWDIVDSVCPKGWHVPTRTEWEKLYADVDESVNQLVDWTPRFNTEKNECKISFVLAGSYTPKRLAPDDVFFDGLYWSSTQCNSEYACVVIPKEASIIGKAFPEQVYMISLRCIKD